VPRIDNKYELAILHDVPPFLRTTLNDVVPAVGVLAVHRQIKQFSLAHARSPTYLFRLQHPHMYAP
jgi:hypothetical protein